MISAFKRVFGESARVHTLHTAYIEISKDNYLQLQSGRRGRGSPAHSVRRCSDVMLPTDRRVRQSYTRHIIENWDRVVKEHEWTRVHVLWYETRTNRVMARDAGRVCLVAATSP